MKVYIGPYKGWFGPYQLAEKLMFWVPEEKDEYGFPKTADRVHKFGEWLAHGNVLPETKVGEYAKMGEDRDRTWLYKFLMWIDSKRSRKIKVHIDRWDTWSMDDTLAYIILPMLKQLKASKHGGPMVDMTDVPEHLRVNDVDSAEYWDSGKTDDKWFERWEWVLDEMIFAFETKVGDLKDWEEQFHTGDFDMQMLKKEDGNYQLVKGPNHTNKWDKEGHKAYQERISNGFRLFGKYYEALWD